MRKLFTLLWACLIPFLGVMAQQRYHTVEAGETVYSISHKYGISEEDIYRLNPGARETIYVCQQLILPNSVTAAPKLENSTVASPKKHLNVGVVLPLKEGGEKGIQSIEFYRGLLMAVDKIKQEGTSVDVHAIHSGSTLLDIQFVLSKEELKSMDVIFGPYDSTQAPALTTFCHQNGIRLVMPFPATQNAGNDFPKVYLTCSDQQIYNDAVEISYAMFNEYNIILLDTGTSTERGSFFTIALTNKLAQNGIVPRKLAIGADDFAMESALNQSKKNVIVSNASDEASLQRLLTKIMSYQSRTGKRFEICLLGYPEWINYTNLKGQMHAVNTYIWNPYQVNPSDPRWVQFGQEYQNAFHATLSNTLPHYSMAGLDLGYYFMHGISLFGNGFEQLQGTVPYSPLQNGVQFNPLQDKPNSAWINHKMYLIHYQPSGATEVLQVTKQ